MKKIKSLLLIIIATVFILPLSVFAEDKELVKVYIFEAGGCPFCEREVEYLESLSSYNKKFTIVRKQLYIDHVDWEEGKDFDLGVKVAEAFTKAGYENASYYGTPFIVISNIYANTSYDTSLEGYINRAYEEGDKDIVSHIENGDSDYTISAPTVSNVSSQTPTINKDGKENKRALVLGIIAVVIIIIGAVKVLVIDKRKKNK